MTELLELEYAHDGLGALLSKARQISSELEHYAAAAVSDARSRGAGWDDVAQAACQSRSTVRSRWNDSAVTRLFINRLKDRENSLLARPAPFAARQELLADAQAGLGEKETQAARASQKIALALSFLHRHSGLHIKQVADRTGLSASYVSRILSGERMPTWTAVRLLAETYDAEPTDLRLLWEASHGLARTARPPLEDAVARLAGALRGMYLAAGCPTYEQVAEASAGVLEAGIVEGALTGRIVPCWETTSSLLTALNAQPGDLRGVWEDTNYSFLVCLMMSPHDAPPPLPAPADD
ncbi:helix-turn-helix domain-containing protein [Streptomyces coeruleoprunus]|uniref:Helix-turn-helix domain-containing protein n=1 Tax=Streptomyces coeruleoprunus TaxID=285563 RepID=A0ABV9XQI0_9ACTN